MKRWMLEEPQLRSWRELDGTGVRWVFFLLSLSGLVLAQPGLAQDPPTGGGAGAGYVLQTITGGGGAVVRSPSQERYASNTAVMITAVADPGWWFKGWLGDVDSSTTWRATNVVVMNRDKCVEAVFVTVLDLRILGEGSLLVDPALHELPFGSFCLISAVPEPGYAFSAWSGAASGDVAPLTFQVTNPTPALVASFVPLTPGYLALSLRVVGRGSVTVNPFRANQYLSGQFVQIVATPEPGEEFVGWSGNGSGADSPLDLLMDGNKVVTATFTDHPHLSVGPCLGGLKEDGFQLTLESLLGGAFRVDWTEGFSSWTPLVNVTNTLGKVQAVDPDALGRGHRFYRAQALP